MNIDFCQESVKNNGNSKGFTLIELLVVIAIIGILSTLSVVVLVNARKNAKITTANAEIKELMKAVVIAQGESGMYLKDITGDGCSDCICIGIGNLRNISESSACYIDWMSALEGIQDASAGIILNMKSFDRDPWGSPYQLDENEGEFPADPCRNDRIRSAGPDGIRISSDDISYIMPFSIACP